MWIPYPTASYGTCYTFNSATNAQDTNVPRISSLTGSANGLTLEIFLDQVNEWLHQRSGMSHQFMDWMTFYSPRITTWAIRSPKTLARGWYCTILSESLSPTRMELTSVPALQAQYLPHWSITFHNFCDKLYSIQNYRQK